MATGITIGQRCDAESHGVGRHMPAVGQERHRTEHAAADDLGDHHPQRQPDHEPGAAFVTRVMRAEEVVIVGPVIQRVRMHRQSSIAQTISSRDHE